MNRLSWLLVAVLGILPALSTAQNFDPNKLRQAIAGADRDLNDFVRDSVRRPVEVLEFLGLEPGMKVLDLYAAGGYYTFILSKAVGDDGTVYAQNTSRGRQFVEDKQEITQGQALDSKIERGRLTNVVQIIAPLKDLTLPPNSLDGIILAQTLHDTYNNNPARALSMLVKLRSLLKPGGFIGITDHIGLDGNNNSALHRITLAQARGISAEAGFDVTESDLLRVSTDEYKRSIFDPRLNRTTDRLLLKLTKRSN
ncbi:MAG: hypothetical protein AB8B95_02535 [Pseudohongiellaceae bacterium]